MSSFHHSKFFSSQFKNILHLTQSAAAACLPHIGSGNQTAADQSAVQAMRKAFQSLPIKGQVVIGEGERDKAPMLFIGEKVGQWKNQDPEIDIAVDPLEGTNLCAKAARGAVSVLALSEKGGLFKAPDIYMEKIACGALAKNVIDLNKSPTENIKSVAKVLNKKLSDMTIAILNRPRHQELVQSVYKLGAHVHLIEDGDLFASLQTTWKTNTPIDLVMGIGGAPEGVLSAAALKCLGGGFQGRLVFRNDKEKQRTIQIGVKDLNRVYQRDELAKSATIFCATAITDNPLLKGIQKTTKHMEMESLYMDSFSGERTIIHTNSIPNEK